MGSGGANCGTGVLLLCCLPAIVSTLSLNLSDQVRAGAAWGKGADSSVCVSMIDTPRAYACPDTPLGSDWLR